MAPAAKGEVIVHERRSGRTFALRFRAYGKRRYLTLGSAEEGWTRQRAEEELSNVLADVRRGIWRPPEPGPVASGGGHDLTFHEFASEWLEALRHEELKESTLGEYRWELSNHLLPFFAEHRLTRSRSPP
jgi:integrase